MPGPPPPGSDMAEFVEKRKKREEREGWIVARGEMRIGSRESPLVTVVGRGIAVCVWDRARLVAGGAHFVEPATYDPAKATCRYGNVAVPALAAMMTKESAAALLEAHLFGGASLDSKDGTGHANAAMARKVLSNRGIPIVSEDVGGSKGRKVMFDPATGHAAVLKVHSIRREDWGN